MRKSTFAWITVIALISFAVRIIGWQSVYHPDGSVYFVDGDPMIHLRQILLHMEVFPKISVFDPYLGYPKGTGQLWAPLFDYLLAAIALLFDGTRETVEWIAIWTSPVLGALTVYPLYLLARHFTDRKGAYATIIAYAFIPAACWVTIAGPVNHHVVEVLFLVLAMLALLRVQKRGTGLYAVLFLSLFFWRGAIVHWALVASASTFYLLFEKKDSEESKQRIALNLSNTYYSLAATVAPFCFFEFAGATNAILFNRISWIHVMVAAIAGIFFGYFVLEGRAQKAQVLTRGAIVLICGGWLAGRELWNGISKAMVGKDAWLSTMEMYHSALFRFPSGELDLITLLLQLTPFFLLVPYVIWMGFRAFREEGGVKNAVIVVCFSLLFIMPLIRGRYMPWAGILVALTAGIIFSKEMKGSFKWASTSRAMILLVVVLAPACLFLNNLAGRVPSDNMLARRDLFTFLRERTPKVSADKPEYSVMADWGMSAGIVYYGERPVVGTCFGWETHGLYESAGFTVTSDPKLALQILRENGSRYVVFGGSERYPLLALENLHLITKDYLAAKGYSQTLDPAISMFGRLYVHGNKPFLHKGQLVTPLPEYKLVYETDLMIRDYFSGESKPAYRVYEVKI